MMRRLSTTAATATARWSLRPSSLSSSSSSSSIIRRIPSSSSIIHHCCNTASSFSSSSSAVSPPPSACSSFSTSSSSSSTGLPSSSLYRSTTCSALSSIVASVNPSSPSDVVTLSGWLQSSRSLGDRWFGVLRDSSGSVQITWSRSDDASVNAIQYQSISKLALESVIRVRGRLYARPIAMHNNAQPLGSVELIIDHVDVLNACTLPMPFSLESDSPLSIVSEEQRLKYRHLDLRRPWMNHLLRLRSSITRAIRFRLLDRDFVEVETPLLFKSTPEGADEFLVPSRSCGRFYALPQSPQQHKQLLMVAGIDRYFQVARCFRDEGSRADRQPEFTQVDMEMAFVERQDVMNTMEGIMHSVLTESNLPSALRDRLGVDVAFPLAQMSYATAMEHYGVDKPDTRYELRLHTITPLVRDALESRQVKCSVFEPLLSSSTLSPSSSPSSSSTSSSQSSSSTSGGCIRAMVVRGLSGLTRRELDVLQRDLGRAVLIARVTSDGGFKTPTLFQPLFSDPSFHAAINKQLDTNVGDMVLVVGSASYNDACAALGRARIHMAHVLCDKRLLHISARQINMYWVVDFPLFDFTIPSSTATHAHPLTLASIGLQSQHHPFTAPREEDMDSLMIVINELTAIAATSNASNAVPITIRDVTLSPHHIPLLSSIRGQHYDLVCNGIELGGGSIRIHQSELQTHILNMVGAPLHVFSHLLTALQHGAPPHGGMAVGLDRIVALLGAAVQEQQLKDMSSSSSSSSTAVPHRIGDYGLSLPIREVIAFPKTTTGQDLMVDAPSYIDAHVLKQYHIQTIAVAATVTVPPPSLTKDTKVDSVTNESGTK